MEGLKTLASNLGAARLAMIGIVSALVLGGLVALATYANKPAMGLLYTDLDPGAAKAITDKLNGLGIAYEISPDGTAVMAPQKDLARLRMDLAAEQLGGPVGYELLDKQDGLGTTSFMQNVNQLRALEGELARSIQSLNAVQTARVHLVVPQRQLFDRESRPPSASITLKTRGRLPPGQVNAIRHLVASSVPDLSPGRISIVDQSGTLLASADSGDGTDLLGVMSDRQSQIEGRLRQQIETMLERIVGPGRARVEVSAELNSEQVRQEAELYDPERQVVAKSTTVEVSNENRNAENNQDVSVENNLPEGGQTEAAGTTSQSAGRENREETTFANSRTRTTTIRDSGSVKRLSVAVLVDGTYNTANGRTAYQPRSAQEIEQLTRLVRSAVGFDEERGDTVEIVNLRFAEEPKAESSAETSGLPLGLQSDDVARLLQTLVIGLVGLAALFFIVRPLLRKPKAVAGEVGPDGVLLSPTGAAGQLAGPDERLALAPPAGDNIVALIERAAQGDDEAMALVRERKASGDVRLSIESEIDVAQIEGKVKAAALKKVGDVVNRYPGEATSVIRQWMTA